ncbi:hypothetical protein HDU87_003218 [Geranomyces variabilis]|uniref:Lysosomal dipeptide transporter MFSD1 n=1 Tax=Geranomyces variabilis TaxID=109894 RepID=A0AAD5TMK4_9FUNG|nr:hypothetical protein HDU87_003218 [Geranomyces variabilis]
MLSLLYALYSLPNTVLPFFGGHLGDVLGPRRMLIAFSATVVVGQVVFSVGLQGDVMWMMAVGRTVFGVGAESLGVVQTQITTARFRNHELALALGMNLSIARLGSVLNDLLTPVLGTISVPLAVWTASAFCVLSFLCAVLLARVCDDDVARRVAAGEPPRVQRSALWTAVVTYPKEFWMLGGVLCGLYATVIPFNTIHAGFLSEKFYPDNPQKAAQLTSIPDTLSALLVPLVGYLTDKYGRRVQTIVACAALITATHLLLGLGPSSISPIPALAVLGCAYAMLLTFWPCVALVVGDERSGLAFGITTSLMNISLTLIPPLVAALISGDSSYTSAELLFATCGTLAGCVAVVLSRTRVGRALDSRDGARDTDKPASLVRDEGGVELQSYAVLQQDDGYDDDDDDDDDDDGYGGGGGLNVRRDDELRNAKRVVVHAGESAEELEDVV